MLTPLEPASVVLTTVRPIINLVLESVIYLPSENPVTFALVALISAPILSSIFPGEVAYPVLLIVLPVTIVPASVDPFIDAVAFHLVVDEISLKGTAVRPDELTAPVLLSRLVVSFKDGAVGPNFLAITIMFIIYPLAFVESPVNVGVLASAIGSVVLPVADVVVGVAVDDATVPFLMIVKKVAIVSCSVRPDLRSFTMTLTVITPLASILDFGGKKDLGPMTHCLSTFLNHSLCYRVVPSEVSEFSQFLIDLRVDIVRG